MVGIPIPAPLDVVVGKEFFGVNRPQKLFNRRRIAAGFLKNNPGERKEVFFIAVQRLGEHGTDFYERKRREFNLPDAHILGEQRVQHFSQRMMRQHVAVAISADHQQRLPLDAGQ